MSKKELKKYLQKYLSKDEISKKKKKTKPKAEVVPSVPIKKPTSRIIDDDIDMSKIRGGDQDLMDLELGEDAPQIAGIVDERPVIIQAEERFGSYRWKAIAVDENKSHNSASTNNEVKTEPKNKTSKKSRHDSDSDESPARKSRKDSPKNRQRHGSNSSSPREEKKENVKSRHDSDSDISKEKISKQESDSDISPPRQNVTNLSKSSKNDESRHDSDSDMSPPRKRDANLPKHSKAERDRHDSDSDMSPPRRKEAKSPPKTEKSKSIPRDSDSDLSPPRTTKQDADISPSGSKSRNDRSPSRSSNTKSRKLDRTLDGKTAGLSTGAAVRREGLERRKMEEEFLSKIENDGRNAVTIVRDRATGKRQNLVEKERREREKQAKIAERKAKYDKWGRGLKQLEMKEEKLQSDINEMNKPLARYADDADLDKYLREQERDGDPMLKFLKKKKKKKEGEKSSAIDDDDKPKYKGSAPPNRFKIRPGYRWDGVDRSNGFERERFERLANAQAHNVDVYKWSIEDM